MVWNSVGEFFHMGGYGLYVWGSVVVTFGFMLSEVGLLKLRRQSAINQLTRQRTYEDDETLAADRGGEEPEQDENRSMRS